ncbi:glucosamine-6-phosphate deaminase [Hydrotalea sandarakina]|jgi:glucosamine-6-phosphate deaminase|uniref:Glucosamine-6-phosphate deaminase n=1 Tax=Hydrotalea sandarakina TaxID=1004304 RepID=A0A2W7S1N5_9BACT|nr:glucosamine-6-phosphate deaminase [Hydrotalea sandarakina]PZX64660.1 glucosamine-6-phosphate deaminase [Hydrotalea sandarakina]
MNIHILTNKNILGVYAGENAAESIKKAIKSNGTANIILATGSSQFETLNYLIADKEIEWSKVRMFHLDEYIGINQYHKASFRKYLIERFLNKVSPLMETILINGENDALEECKRISNLIMKYSIDVALVGIGENGHLAFNDPPADFETEKPFLIVNLNNECKQQQVNEGWFNELNEVPNQAISMSIKQIMKSKKIICSVPDKRKAIAVEHCIKNQVSNLFPASILQLHPSCDIYLDYDSASNLFNLKH